MPASASSGGFNSPTLSQGVGALGNIAGIESGLNRGGVLGTAGAVTSAGGLWNNVYGTNNGSAIPYIGAAGNALGVINGIKQGGVMGYGGAAINAAGLYGTAANAGLFGQGAAGAASGAGSAIPFLGAGLADYEAVKNWQSGATGADALGGAEAGASTGAAIGSIVPGIGTLVGGVAGLLIGGAAGALSSIAGPGKTSQEALGAQKYTAAFDQQSAAGQQQLASVQSPSQNVQYIQGELNGSNPTAGHSTALEQVFGKNNVAGFTTQMTQTVNSAISKGTIPKNATPAQIYSKVVVPWLTSKGANMSAGNTVDVKGNSVANPLQDAITNMLGQWQSGSFTSKTAVGVKGQTINMPVYGG